MKKTISKDGFRESFKRIGRQSQFSYEALGAIYDHLTDLEEDCEYEYEIELDPIAICCEFSEYDTPLEAARQYTEPNSWKAMIDRDANISALNWILNRSTALTFEGGLVVHDW